MKNKNGGVVGFGGQVAPGDCWWRSSFKDEGNTGELTKGDAGHRRTAVGDHCFGRRNDGQTLCMLRSQGKICNFCLFALRKKEITAESYPNIGQSCIIKAR